MGTTPMSIVTLINIQLMLVPSRYYKRQRHAKESESNLNPDGTPASTSPRLKSKGRAKPLLMKRLGTREPLRIGLLRGHSERGKSVRCVNCRIR